MCVCVNSAVIVHNNNNNNNTVLEWLALSSYYDDTLAHMLRRSLENNYDTPNGVRPHEQHTDCISCDLTIFTR